MAKNHIIPIFLPMVGCPHRCSYCDQFTITGASPLSPGEVGALIEEALPRAGAREGELEIAFYGGTFTLLPPAAMEAYLQVAGAYSQKIRISTRPDAVDEELLNFLKERGVATIEFGIQSTDAEVLSRANRSIPLPVMEEACHLVRKVGMKLGLQQMMGLPQDSLKKCLKTARWMIDQRPDFVRIYPTQVFPNTPLAEDYDRGAYSPLSLVEAVDWLAALLKVYDREGIPVIRVALPPQEGARGPFHPQLRELAEHQLCYEKFIAGEDLNHLLGAVGEARSINLLVGPGAMGRKKLEAATKRKLKFQYGEGPLRGIYGEALQGAREVLKEGKGDLCT
ncbi:MAG: radical SAM protein [Tissierellia bacterium]|nr:radical SAM protein [Tissierellia bacterium]